MNQKKLKQFLGTPILAPRKNIKKSFSTVKLGCLQKTRPQKFERLLSYSNFKLEKNILKKFLNFCKAKKNCDYTANFFYMGPHYVDFTFAFDTTLIQLEMTEILPKYVAQAFLPPPGIVSSEPPLG